jgi:hypothetical protein
LLFQFNQASGKKLQAIDLPVGFWGGSVGDITIKKGE